MNNNTLDLPTSPSDGQFAGPGAALAAARAARKMSVEDVSRMLKLPVSKVLALEADDYSNMPSPMFARGFVRSYARLLQLDIERLMPEAAGPTANLDARLMHRAPGVPLEPRRSGRVPAMMAGVALVLAGLVYYEFALNNPPAPFQIASNSTMQRLPTESPAGDESMSAAGASTTGPMVPAVPMVASAAEAPVSSYAASDHLRLKKSVDPTSGANEKGLHFLFNGESWVEVRDRVGKVVFSKTNAPGSERIVQGEPPFSLVIGGASGVQLSYNGSPVNLASYVTEDVARLRLE